MTTRRRKFAFVPAAALLLFFSTTLRAQELEPRAYSPAPTGTNLVLATYSYQSGEVLFDPALPFSDVEAFIHGAVVGYAKTFGLFGRSAQVAAAVPYVWASVGGNVGEARQEITRSGLGDPRLRFVVNLIGGPALPPPAWVKRKPETTLGFSLVVVVPTGQYSPEKLINIGTNRWAIKPEFGLSVPYKRWTFEGAAGGWFFTDNNATYPGTNVRSQDPLWTFQAHVGYTVKPGLWVAFDATWYTGGQTYTNDVPGDTRQSNTRAGLTASIPVGKRQTIKVSAATGVSSRVGSRFDTYAIGYQFLWFDGAPKKP